MDLYHPKVCSAKSSSGDQPLQVMLQAPRGAERWEHVVWVSAGLLHCSHMPGWACGSIFCCRHSSRLYHAPSRTAVFSYELSKSLPTQDVTLLLNQCSCIHKTTHQILAWTCTACISTQGLGTNGTTSCGCRVETSTLSVASDSWDELVWHLSKKGISGKGC